MPTFGPKGEGAIFRHEKSHDKQPDFRGKIEITRAQLHALVDRAKENNDPTFELQGAVWNRVAKESGNAYMYCSTEVFTPKVDNGYERQASRPTGRDRSTSRDDDWDV